MLSSLGCSPQPPESRERRSIADVGAAYGHARGRHVRHAPTLAPPRVKPGDPGAAPIATYPVAMAREPEVTLPGGSLDDRELLLSWLSWLRAAVLRKIHGLDEEQARWTPDGKLISLLGIVNHLTHVEWRWIDGAMRGEETDRKEAEFRPGRELTVELAVAAYQARAEATDDYVRSTTATQPSRNDDGTDLRWVLIHLINETARHAGHADATRQLIDGLTGE